jgi:hypothetical protein
MVCGAGAERVVQRAPALASRILTWHQVSRIEHTHTPSVLRLFHPLWAAADPADALETDETCAQGNFPDLGEDHCSCVRRREARPQSACGPHAAHPGTRPPGPLPLNWPGQLAKVLP